MKKILPIGITALLVLAFIGTVSAQLTETRIITIVPPTVQKSLNPGEITEGTMKVINDSNETLTFKAAVRDFVVKDNQGTPDILPPNTLSNKYSAAAWIGVDPSTFTIDPHQKQNLNFYLQVPADAKPGGHYAAVVYEPTSPVLIQGTGAGVNTQIGTLFYVDVKGDIKEDARVVQFKTNGFSEFGPVNLNTEILNLGDLHIKPQGVITVTDIFGRKVEAKALEEHNIFPEKTFLYTSSLGSRWMIGRYTAKLTATYGKANNLPLVATVSFVVFPWKLATVMALLAIIAILLVILAKKKKQGKHHENVESEENHPVL